MNTAPNPVALRWCLAFTCAAAALLTAGVYFGWPGGTWLKMSASTGFLATAVVAGGSHTAYGRAILVGLVCSWWGDLFLNLSGAHYFMMGLVAFLLAHVAYSAAFLIHGVRAPWTAAGLAITLAAGFPIVRWLHPHLGDMRYPVYAYVVVISLMVTLAIGAQGRSPNRLLLVGALLFYISDLFVARQRFVESSVWNPLIGLPVYFLAQLLLASSIPTTVKSKPQSPN